MEEVGSIASKKGINLSYDDIDAYEPTIKSVPFFNKPSTLQDIENSKKTEIDMFAGRMVELGKELGVETPLSFMFLHGIKVLEEKNDSLFSM